MPFDLSIVIPVFNKYNFTKSCLNDLSQLSDAHEIIIVDNASTDETNKEITDMKISLPELRHKLIYKRNDVNLGFAKACNIGYRMATAPNVLFLNNDIKVSSNHTGWTADLIKWASTSIVGPTMGQLDDNLNFVQEADKLLSGKSYMSGWCLASSKEIWSKLDISGTEEIFSEDFFCYFEDTDLSFRARELGIPMQIIQVPVVHFGKVSSKQLNTHALYSKARASFIKKWDKLIKN